MVVYTSWLLIKSFTAVGAPLTTEHLMSNEDPAVTELSSAKSVKRTIKSGLPGLIPKITAFSVLNLYVEFGLSEPIA